MNEERRDKLAKEHADAAYEREVELSSPYEASDPDTVSAAFRAGWNACYAEMLTTRKKDEEKSC